MPFKDPEIVPAGGTPVRLSSRIVGIYHASSAGGPYPSNAYVSWQQNGAYYAIALNAGSLADILLTARSMR
jgi:proteasome lid subunit RPN8/RPN11